MSDKVNPSHFDHTFSAYTGTTNQNIEKISLHVSLDKEHNVPYPMKREGTWNLIWFGKSDQISSTVTMHTANKNMKIYLQKYVSSKLHVSPILLTYSRG